MLHALLALAWAGEPTFTVDPARSAAIVGTAAALEWAIHTRIVPEAEPDGEVAAPVGPDAWVPAHYAPSVGRVSDVLLGATLIGGTALALHDGLRDGQAPMARLWIVGEAVATTLVATDVLKLTFTRPRPYTALEDDPAVAAQRRGFDSEMSFPSGHSSLAAAAAVSTVRMLALSGSTRSQRIWAWSGAALAAGGVAALRVGAGKHHPTDVVAGLLLGGSIGWLVPTLHLERSDLVVVPTGSGVALRWSW